MNEQAWFFYIVRCNDNSLYSGITPNLEKRVKKHNAGKGARYTNQRRLVTLVFSEKFPDISTARKREAQIKRLSKVKKELLIKGTLD